MNDAATPGKAVGRLHETSGQTVSRPSGGGAQLRLVQPQLLDNFTSPWRRPGGVAALGDIGDPRCSSSPRTRSTCNRSVRARALADQPFIDEHLDSVRAGSDLGRDGG
jgi:hypothetical protein